MINSPTISPTIYPPAIQTLTDRLHSLQSSRYTAEQGDNFSASNGTLRAFDASIMMVRRELIYELFRASMDVDRFMSGRI